MRYFYIDYENINEYGCKGIASLGKDDIIVIYYSQKAQKLTFELHISLCETKAKKEYKKMRDIKIKNNLDVNLLSDLDKIMAKDKDKKGEYYIVSKDKGYDNFVNVQKDRGYIIKKISAISAISDFHNNEENIEKKKSKAKDLKTNKNAVKPVDTKNAKAKSVCKNKGPENNKITTDNSKTNKDDEYKKTRHDKVEGLLDNSPYKDEKKYILDSLDNAYGHYQDMFDDLDKKYGENDRKKIWGVIRSAF